jgi:polysaccharide biosynthesis transport protein
MKKVVTIAARHWKSLLVLNALVAIGTIAAYSTSKPVWTTTAQLILPKTTSNLDASLGTLGTFKNGNLDFSPELNPLKVQTSILMSDALLEKVLDSDPEKDDFKNLAQYKALFLVSPQEQSTVLSLTVSASKPDLAKERAQNLIKAYQARLDELREANSKERQKFNVKELEQAKAKLNNAQSKIARFKQATGIVNNDAQTQGIVNTINTLVASRAQALSVAQASATRSKTLSERINLAPASAVRSLSLGENQEFQSVRKQLSEVEAKLVQKQAIFTINHPDIQNLLIQRAALIRQVQGYIGQVAGNIPVDPTVTTDSQGRAILIQQQLLAESEASAQLQQARQIESQIMELQKYLGSLPEKQAQLLELQRQLDVAEGVYKGLVAQVQQKNVDAFNAYPNVQVLDPPRVNAKPISPKLLLMAINALLASVIGSIALILFLESRNPLLSAKDLQEQKFAIVERIPRIKNSGVISELPTESEVEFQRLASAISLQSLENRRLLVTSAIMGEGKTTVAIGLANALVDLGFKVLLVDADFRQAALSRRLGYTEDATDSLSISIQPNLDLLPTLPREGKIVEIIRRGNFEKTLASCEMNGKYDYIIVDSAPVSFTSETSLIANIIRNVLFVVRPDTSYRDSVNQSFAQLTQHNAQILGLVVNGVETNSRPYSYAHGASITKNLS